MSRSKTSGPAAADVRWLARAVLCVILVVLATAALLWLLYALRRVILLLALAVFFAYMLAPLVRGFRRPTRVAGRRVEPSQGLAIAVVYLLLFLAVATVGRLVGPSLSLQLTELSRQAPEYFAALNERVQHLGALASAYNLPPEAQRAIDNAASSALQSVSDAARGFAVWAFASLTYVSWLVLVPILGFFLLKDGESMRRRAVDAVPPGRRRDTAVRILGSIDRTIASYIRAQLIACILVGTVCTVAFSIIGVPFALVLGVFAGLLEFIPVVGPFAVAVVVATVSGLSSVHTATVALAFLVVLRVVEDYVVYPRIVGRGTHLNPLAVILAVLCGAEIAGVAGVFLAVPVAGILTVLDAELGGPKEILAEILESPPVGADAPLVESPKRPARPRA